MRRCMLDEDDDDDDERLAAQVRSFTRGFVNWMLCLVGCEAGFLAGDACLG